MEDETTEEFKEKFATIEEALKYIADSQAKSEWIYKRDQVEWRKRQEAFAEQQKASEGRMEQIEKELHQITKHLRHITKLVGISLEDLMFQEEKIQEAGTALSRRREQK